MSASKVRRMFPVESSMIQSVGFIPLHEQTGAGTMLVLFKNGDVYRYEGVASFAYVSLLNAVSIGIEFKALTNRISIKTAKLTMAEAVEMGVPGLDARSSQPEAPAYARKQEKNDDVPMLDVMSVDSSARVGKVSSVTSGQGRKKR